MTLRQLLHSLATDEAARTDFLSDPSGALARSGLEGLGEDLLSTALVHHADTAPLDHLEGLVPLLDRFVPLPDHPRSVHETGGPEGPSDADVDPGLLFDDLGPADPTPGSTATEPVEDPAPPTTSSGDRSDHSSRDVSDDPSHGDFGTGAIPITASTAPPPAPPTPEVEPEWSADTGTVTPEVEVHPPFDEVREGDDLPPERAVDDTSLHDDAFDTLE